LAVSAEKSQKPNKKLAFLLKDVPKNTNNQAGPLKNWRDYKE